MSTFKPKALATLQLSTALVHSQKVSAQGFESQHTPVYRGSSVFFKDTATQRTPVDPLGIDYTYGLHGNPTQYTLAKKLAEIEGATHVLLCPSGLAAIALVAQACLKTGDHWLIPSNVYGPAQTIAQRQMESYNVTFSEYDPSNIKHLKASIQTNTKLIWVEAPGSLTFEVPPLKEVVDLAKQHGCLLAIDNTWSAGITFKPFEMGFDYSVQALTKYQCGHADVLMGAVLGNESTTFSLIEQQNRILGLGVSPSDCELVLRGLLTLPLRYATQAKTALHIAKALEKHPKIRRVLHPAFPSCIGHEHWKTHFTGAASVFSIELNPALSDAQACAFVDGLQFFKIAYSWGGPESLALVVNLPPSRFKPFEDEQNKCGPIIRLAIGLEDPQDLIEDLNTQLANL